jgi:biotin transport system substrate-specific component
LTTLAAAVWPTRTQSAALTRNALLALIGALALTVSAKLQIPFWPIPMTMQTYVVLVIGMAYGARLGLSTIALYLALGAMGVPVFAGTPEKGIGLPYMLGPTGGYLVGFLFASSCCAWFAARGFGRSFWKTLAAMTVGHLVIFAFGLAWLTVLMGFSKAFAVGVAPFWAATIAKTLLGVVTLPLAWRWAQAAK